jgi:hypothetical protein
MHKGVCVLCAAAAIGMPAYGQAELVLSLNEVSVGSWELYGELMNPQGAIDAAVWDLSFALEGTQLSNFAYNTAFDTDFFGSPAITLSPTLIAFRGLNPGGPLANSGGPDSSNPIFLVSFNADSVTDFELVGQNSGSYESGGVFPIIFFYQLADGTPGTVPFRVELNPIPVPSTALILGIAGFGLLGRRR